MGKRKRNKEKPIDNGEAVTKVIDVAKDIDEIFAAKKVLSSPLELSKTEIPKKAKIQSTSSVANVKSTEGKMATVQDQMQAVKAGRLDKPVRVTKDDDFGDIRGTKKRIRFIYYTTYL